MSLLKLILSMVLITFFASSLVANPGHYMAIISKNTDDSRKMLAKAIFSVDSAQAIRIQINSLIEGNVILKGPQELSLGKMVMGPGPFGLIEKTIATISGDLLDYRICIDQNCGKILPVLTQLY